MDYELTLGKIIALIGIESLPPSGRRNPDDSESVKWTTVIDDGFSSSNVNTMGPTYDPFSNSSYPDPFASDLVCVGNDPQATFWTHDEVLGKDVYRRFENYESESLSDA